MMDVLLRDWASFSREVRRLCDNDPYSGSFVFRGHGQEDYKLSTSFDREVVDSLKKKNDSFSIISKSFKDRAATHLGESLSEDAWLGVAQHYGLPTRVLDWTLSPYVGAFFAISSYLRSEKKTLPTLWVLHKKHVEKTLDKRELRFIGYQPNVDLRIKNQKGVFTEIQDDTACLQTFLHAKGLADCLRKLRISRSIIADAIRDLSLMDISYERLFPGLEGLAKQIWFEFQVELIPAAPGSRRRAR